MAPKQEKQKSRPDLDDQAWIVWLSQQPENRGIPVAEMYRKMLDWCLKKGVTPTRRRLLKWLDTEREAMPMTYEPAYFEPKPEHTPETPKCPTCKDCGEVTQPAKQPKFTGQVEFVPCPDCKEKNNPNG